MSVSVAERIADDVKSNDVVLFMKGTPVFPQCGFSAAVVQILTDLGVKVQNLRRAQGSRTPPGVKEFSNWPTVPQLYVKGEFVGGCDIIREMHESNELEALLKQHGVALENA